jgi:alpha-aminoadipate carrier protein LysW
MTTSTAPAATCPECDASIPFDRSPLNGQVVRCSDCGAELEVTGLNPLTLALAPEVEEDWGE